VRRRSHRTGDGTADDSGARVGPDDGTSTDGCTCASTDDGRALGWRLSSERAG